MRSQRVQPIEVKCNRFMLLLVPHTHTQRLLLLVLTAKKELSSWMAPSSSLRSKLHKAAAAAAAALSPLGSPFTTDKRGTWLPLLQNLLGGDICTAFRCTEEASSQKRKETGLVFLLFPPNRKGIAVSVGGFRRVMNDFNHEPIHKLHPPISILSRHLTTPRVISNAHCAHTIRKRRRRRWQKEIVAHSR